MSESTIKIMIEPISHLIDNCGRSDCHSKCCDCFEFEIEHSRPSRDPNISSENKSKIQILAKVTLMIQTHKSCRKTPMPFS